MGGALAKLALHQLGIEVTAYTSQVGPIRLEGNYDAYDLTQVESNAVRCPDAQKAAAAQEGLALDVESLVLILGAGDFLA